eukprot:scaffold26410_cov117-Cylindrotheca_fusiformis.AAC.1
MPACSAKSRHKETRPKRRLSKTLSAICMGEFHFLLKCCGYAIYMPSCHVIVIDGKQTHQEKKDDYEMLLVLT